MPATPRRSRPDPHVPRRPHLTLTPPAPTPTPQHPLPTAQFTDTSTNTPTSWAWNFGDTGSGASNTSTQQNPTHTFSAAGTYTVTLTASNSGGPSTPPASKQITVSTVPQAPVASFTNTATGLTAQFTDTSTNTPTSWAWNFGDTGSGASNTSTQQNPTHTFSAAGTYTVTLTASNSGGPSTPPASKQITVSTVPQAPVASFTNTATGLTAQFTDTSTNTPTSWAWNFGDTGSGASNTSTQQNPTHTFSAAGTYTVTLTASNSGGPSTPPASKQITVSTVPQAPVASFTNTATGLTAQFTDTSTNTPTSWAWNFGDTGSGASNTSTQQNPTHTFSAAGTYTVTLTASNSGGPSTPPASKQITVSTVPQAPVASFTNTATGLTAQFTDTSTNTPTSWAWNFGDTGSGASNTSTQQNPTHTFSAAGTYTVTLTASNSGGPSTPPASKQITVSTVPQAPVASFTNTATGLTAQFTDTSTNTPTSWAWNFGDTGSGASNTSTQQNPTHTFSAAGTYTVTLTASNSGGPSTPPANKQITVSTSQPSQLTFSPIADSYTASGTPTTTFGTSIALHAKMTPSSVKRVYYKFTVAGTAGKTLTGAKLRLYVSDASVAGGSIFSTTSTWTETGLNWSNQPAPVGSALSTLGAVALGATVEFTVTPAISGDNTYSFVITSPSTDTVYYGSKEAAAARRPQLVLTFS